MKESILAYFLFFIAFTVSSQNSTNSSAVQPCQIVGTWRLSKIVKNNEVKEFDSGLIFEDDGVLKLGFFNMEEIIEAGTWKYNSTDNSIEMKSSIDKNYNGKATEVIVSEQEMTYVKDGLHYHFVRADYNSLGLTPLNFSEKDFFTENGDYKYEGEAQKLPWHDNVAMIKSLEQVSKLVYDYSLWNETERAFDKKLLTADVVANSEEMVLNIDYIFYGYDKYNLPEDTELPPNTEYSALLYPEQEMNFRITGTEELTTPAGTFTCTVIEAAEAETKKILWLIDNKPGIYAKIIIEKPGRFGAFYHGVFQLKNIY